MKSTLYDDIVPPEPKTQAKSTLYDDIIAPEKPAKKPASPAWQQFRQDVLATPTPSSGMPVPKLAPKPGFTKQTPAQVEARVNAAQAKSDFNEKHAFTAEDFGTRKDTGTFAPDIESLRNGTATAGGVIGQPARIIPGAFEGIADATGHALGLTPEDMDEVKKSTSYRAGASGANLIQYFTPGVGQYIGYTSLASLGASLAENPDKTIEGLKTSLNVLDPNIDGITRAERVANVAMLVAMAYHGASGGKKAIDNSAIVNKIVGADGFKGAVKGAFQDITQSNPERQAAHAQVEAGRQNIKEGFGDTLGQKALEAKAQLSRGTVEAAAKEAPRVQAAKNAAGRSTLYDDIVPPKPVEVKPTVQAKVGTNPDLAVKAPEPVAAGESAIAENPAQSVSNVAQSGAKEPWQMTKKAFADTISIASPEEGVKVASLPDGRSVRIRSGGMSDAEVITELHKQVIREALMKGRDVPEAVLQEYPDSYATQGARDALRGEYKQMVLGEIKKHVDDGTPFTQHLVDEFPEVAAKFPHLLPEAAPKTPDILPPAEPPKAPVSGSNEAPKGETFAETKPVEETPIEPAKPKLTGTPKTVLDVTKPSAPKGDTEVTGISNRMQAPKVEAGDITLPEKGKVKTKEELHAQAESTTMEQGESLAKAVKQDAAPFNSENVAKMKAADNKFWQERERLGRELDDAAKSGNPNAGALRTQYEDLKVRHQSFLDDVQKSKTEWRNIGISLQDGLNAKTGSYEYVARETERNQGHALTDSQEAQIRELTRQNQELSKEIEKHQAQADAAADKLKEAEAARIVKNLERQSKGADRAVKITKLRAEREDILSQLGKVSSKLSANPILEIAEGAKLVSRLVRNIAEEGVTHLQELVDKTNAILTANGHEPLTDREVYDALSGYGQETKVSTPSEATAKINLLKAQANLISRINDAIAGVPAGKTPKGIPDPLIAGLRKTLADVKKMTGDVPPTDKTATLNKAIEKALDTLEFGKEEPTAARPDTPEEAALRKKLDAIQKQIADRHGESVETKKIKALESEIASTRARMAKGPAAKVQGPETAKVSALQGELDAARKAYAKRWATPEERAKLDSLDRQIANAKDVLANGTKARLQKEGPQTAAVDALEKQRDAIKAEIAKKYGTSKKAPLSVQGRLMNIERRLVAAKENLANQSRNIKRKAPKDPQVLADAKAKLNNVRQQMNVEDQIHELERKIRDKDFEPKKRPAKAVPPEVESLRRNREMVRAKLRNAIESAKPKTFSDKVSGFHRAAILSRAGTLGKLAGAVAWNIPVSTLADLLGVAPGSLSVGGKSLRSLGSGREGYFNPKAEAINVASHLSGDAVRNAVDTIKSGMNHIDATYYNAKGRAPLQDADVFGAISGRLHGAIKAFSQTGEFNRSVHLRLRQAARMGLDVNDPKVLDDIAMGASVDAQTMILKNDTEAVKALNGAIRTFQHNPSAGVRAIGSVMKTLVPIAKVPTNYIAQAFDYSGAGIVRGTKRFLDARSEFKQTGKLPTAAEADEIIKAYKRGGLGLLAAYVGLVQPDWLKAAGYYQPNSDGNRDTKGKPMEFSDIQVGGVHVPHTYAHNPFLEAVQFWSTVRRNMSQHKDFNSAVAAGVGGALTQAPGMEAAEQVTQAIQPGGASSGKAFGAYVKGWIPGIVQEGAKTLDKDSRGEPIKRRQQGFRETVQEGVPLLRNKLPRAATK